MYDVLMYFLPAHFTIWRQFWIYKTLTFRNILPIAKLTLNQENYPQRGVNKMSQIPVFLLIFFFYFKENIFSIPPQFTRGSFFKRKTSNCFIFISLNVPPWLNTCTCRSEEPPWDMYITMTIMILSQIISIFNDSRHLWGARCALFPGVHVHSVWKIAISEKLNQFFSEMIAHYLVMW